IAVEGDIFTDPTVARVRIWDKDGLLLGSSDPNEVVGQLQVTKDAYFTDALARKTESHVVQEDFTISTVGAAPEQTQLLEGTTPFMVKDQVDPAGVAQMDLFYARLESAAANPWHTWWLICVIGAIVAGILFVVAMVRKPVAAMEVEAPVEETPEEADAEPAVAAATTPTRDQELEEELKIAREQLKQASEAFAFLEHRVQDSPCRPASTA